MPDRHNTVDQRLLVFIRRALLDAFWAREPSTVRGNLSAVKKVLKGQDEFQLHVLPPIGPWSPDFDHGMGPAVMLLNDSLRPGRHEVTVKFASVRGIKMVFTNIWAATAENSQDATVWLGRSQAQDDDHHSLDEY